MLSDTDCILCVETDFTKTISIYILSKDLQFRRKFYLLKTMDEFGYLKIAESFCQKKSFSYRYECYVASLHLFYNLHNISGTCHGGTMWSAHKINNNVYSFFETKEQFINSKYKLNLRNWFKTKSNPKIICLKLFKYSTWKLTFRMIKLKGEKCRLR